MRKQWMGLALAMMFLTVPAWAQNQFDLKPTVYNDWVTAAHSGWWTAWSNTTCFSGSGVLTNQGTGLTPVFPSSADNQVRMEYAQVGYMFSDSTPNAYLGDRITPPVGLTVDWNAMRSNNVYVTNYVVYTSLGGTSYVASLVWVTNYVSADGTAVLSPEQGAYYFVNGGETRITWQLAGGGSTTLVYNVAGYSQQRPKRIFWTESPYDAPGVSLAGQYVRIHYTPSLPPAHFEVQYDSQGNPQRVLRDGVYLDPNTALLRAAPPASAYFLIEYFKTGSFQDSLGMVLIQVMEPFIAELPANLGARLLPSDSRYGYSNLEAQVTHGLGNNQNGTVDQSSYVYQHQTQNPNHLQNGWLFAVRKNTDAPWNIEVYWEEPDFMSVYWPFEADWYSADWPDYITKVVRGEAGDDGGLEPVLPSAMNYTILPYQEPPNNSEFQVTGNGQQLQLTGVDGRAIMQMYDLNTENIWFEPLLSISHTNDTFDLRPTQAHVGDELAPEGGISLWFQGQPDAFAVISNASINQDFTLEMWVKCSADVTSMVPWLCVVTGSPATASWWNADPSGVVTNLGQPRLVLGQLPDYEGGVAAGMLALFNSGSSGAVMGVTSGSRVMFNLGQWNHVALTYASANQSMAIFINGALYGGQSLSNVMAQSNWSGLDMPSLAGANLVLGCSLFAGNLDELRLWNRVLSTDEISFYMNRMVNPVLTNYAGLVGCWPVLHLGDPNLLINLSSANRAGDGLLVGVQHANGGPFYANEDIAMYSEYHGYIYDPPGQAPYNVNTYAYPIAQNPDAQTEVFLVNENKHKFEGVADTNNPLANYDIELWWSEDISLLANPPMPTNVYIPNFVQRYQTQWPTNVPQIVLASGLGYTLTNNYTRTINIGMTGQVQVVTNWVANPQLYIQNATNQPGFNPNEEHALFDYLTYYALRDDLNAAGDSRPYVLVQYTDPSNNNQPEMLPLMVVRTNATYPDFTFNMQAGYRIPGPHPLDLLANPNTPNTYCLSGPGWRDRTLTWWAKAAGDFGSNTALMVMRDFYPMQSSFYFPNRNASMSQPALGTPIPWLPGYMNFNSTAYPTSGVPINVKWTVSWPAAPTMDACRTLLTARDGLPDMYNQLSAEILYDQYAAATTGASTNHTTAELIDPISAQAADLQLAANPQYKFPDDFVGPYTSKPGDKVYNRAGIYYFNGLSPIVGERLYYNPYLGSSNLVLIGQYIAPASGGAYLEPNVLSDQQRGEIINLAVGSAKDAIAFALWSNAVMGLARAPIVTAGANQPVTKYALYSTGRGAGYITLVMNNATNPATGVAAGDTISMYVIQVTSNLYLGQIIPLEDQNNILSQMMNLLYSEILPFCIDTNFTFQWQYNPILADGTVNSNNWTDYAVGHSLGMITLGSQGAQLTDFEDNYYRLRYHADPVSQAAPVVGTNWTGWADDALAEGWVQRVLNNLTPFDQKVRDAYDNPINGVIRMVQIAGGPYEGDVALNMQNLDQYGLLQIYHTVRNVALNLIQGRPNVDPAFALQLLLACARLNDLYMLLGNEAFADAQDPMVGFGSTAVFDGAALSIDYGAYASSIYCFENQYNSLLDEELGLLYGRSLADPAPGVRTSPFYNRLMWNWTRGINAGEVAYAMNYNIIGTNQVTITVDTAASLFPQGHGDAWGHYLSALTLFYQHLHIDNIPVENAWVWPADLAVLVGADSVLVDYNFEAKFAEAAVGLARSGAEIVGRVHRKVYDAGGDGMLDGYRDVYTNRAWGLGEWAGRAGQANLYNWLAINAILPYQAPDATNAYQPSLKGKGRATTPELAELASLTAQIQKKAQNADAGLNPLGLAEGSVPFDINPADIDAGKTHYEQIYDRAVQALENATLVFDQAQAFSRLLRQQQESAANYQRSLESMEQDYNARLIEIFGYPYADDIGPGKTYPQGYDGPDLLHFNYIDMSALGSTAFDLGPIQETIFVINDDPDQHEYTVNNTWAGVNGTPQSVTYSWNDGIYPAWNPGAFTITVDVAGCGLPIKPSAWSGCRAAEGQVQRDYATYVHAFINLWNANANLNVSMAKLSATFSDYYKNKKPVFDSAHSSTESLLTYNESWTGLLAPLEMYNYYHEKVGSINQWNLSMMILGTPDSLIAGLADSVPVRIDTAIAALVDYTTTALNAAVIGGIMNGVVTAEKVAGAIWEMEIQKDENDAAHNAQCQAVYQALQALAADVSAKVFNAKVLMQELTMAEQQYKATIQDGYRLQNERATARAGAASRVENARFQDMSFRIFRDDALRRYESAFDMAARYAFLAAKAYDFETGLLSGDTSATPGDTFLSQIVRARTLGQVENGLPMTGSGGIGDPGLADLLARMNANWQVLKGRLGFNNPDADVNRFSLRQELCRIPNDPAYDDEWMNTLQAYVVADLYAVPEFNQYCLPPFGATNSIKYEEPAIVIPFASTIQMAQNFFGYDLAAGDSAYDATHFATKIRSVGIWFSNYNVTAQSGGLSMTPYAYLVPAGNDVLRSPTDEGGQPRAWAVCDQALPLPYDLNQDGNFMSAPDWVAMNATLGESFAALRRHPMLRAYHDAGYTPDQMIMNARLVGRSAWNTRWVLIIPGFTLHSDRNRGIDWFIYGPDGSGGVRDIKLYFRTYSYAGN